MNIEFLVWWEGREGQRAERLCRAAPGDEVEAASEALYAVKMYTKELQKANECSSFYI